MYNRSNLNKIVIVIALISAATFVISSISSFSYNAEAQTFDNNNNNITNVTLLPELFTKVKQSVVTVDVATNARDPSNSSFGSGFIYDNDGHIITTLSSVAAADSTGVIHITFSDGTIHRAKLIGSDSFTDLVVLQVQDVVPKDKLVPLQLEILQS